MAHPEQITFVSTLREVYPQYFSHQKVAEVGSLDINGSVRGLFTGGEYTGFDLSQGPGVDQAIQGQLIGQASGYYDVTISCECFEHNPFWVETYSNMLRLTKSGGLVVMSCTTTGRPEHGTRLSDEESSPLTIKIGWIDYYQNLTSDDFLKTFNLKGWFKAFHILTNPQSNDLYIYGIRKGGDTPSIDFGNIFHVIKTLNGDHGRHVTAWTEELGELVCVVRDSTVTLVNRHS